MTLMFHCRWFAFKVGRFERGGDLGHGYGAQISWGLRPIGGPIYWTQEHHRRWIWAR